jgi:hypothetical protein
MITTLLRCHKTYERVADKGYKSVDMFQNWETPITSMEARKAAQWYGELFTMTSEVEPAYYYRYAQSLRSISDKTNHGEFDQISGNDSRTFAKTKLYGCHKG